MDTKKKKPLSKKVKIEKAALAVFFPDNKDRQNAPYSSKQLLNEFPSLGDLKTVNREMNKCRHRYRQYIPIRERDAAGQLIGYGRIVGWIFDPSGVNQGYVDLEADYIKAGAEKVAVRTVIKLEDLAHTFKDYNRSLGMAHNPKGLPPAIA